MVVHYVAILKRGECVVAARQVQLQILHVVQPLVPVLHRLDVHRTYLVPLAAEVRHQVPTDKATTTANDSLCGHCCFSVGYDVAASKLRGMRHGSELFLSAQYAANLHDRQQGTPCVLTRSLGNVDSGDCASAPI